MILFCFKFIFFVFPQFNTLSTLKIIHKVPRLIVIFGTPCFELSYLFLIELTLNQTDMRTFSPSQVGDILSCDCTIEELKGYTEKLVTVFVRNTATNLIRALDPVVNDLISNNCRTKKTKKEQG